MKKAALLRLIDAARDLLARTPGDEVTEFTVATSEGKGIASEVTIDYVCDEATFAATLPENFARRRIDTVSPDIAADPLFD